VCVLDVVLAVAREVCALGQQALAIYRLLHNSPRLIRFAYSDSILSDNSSRYILGSKAGSA
jgi:hypothetical protein